MGRIISVARVILGVLWFAAAALLLPLTTQAATLTTIYSFADGSDGAYPASGLINVGGILYGTTTQGGTTRGCHGPLLTHPPNCGTMFSITVAGAETVLHRFHLIKNGTDPGAFLTEVGGFLYGTTQFGGLNNNGVLFKINKTTGGETVLHSFAGGRDGQHPVGGLLNIGGILYGTTANGGGCGVGGCGTVFKFDPNTGAERVLHKFVGGSDGAIPSAGVIGVEGSLYGTTQGGGDNDFGTVFKVDLSTGVETVLHAFVGHSPDGVCPCAALLNVGGTLYGTTIFGGRHDFGTVFKIDASTGVETVIHSFAPNSEGGQPFAALIDVGGILYGTTGGYGVNLDGTIFKISETTGNITVLYSFGGSDGAFPVGELLNVGGILYGMTHAGGANGYGTVFSLTR
jgi:uncharacterized repeat protein (TIGR03803 family)